MYILVVLLVFRSTPQLSCRNLKKVVISYRYISSDFEGSVSVWQTEWNFEALAISRRDSKKCRLHARKFTSVY
jgi:hypothetical protein